MRVDVAIKHRVMTFHLAQSYHEDITPEELYEATRRAWKVAMERAKEMEFAIAVHKGIAREVFKIKQWRAVDSERSEFEGELAPYDIRKHYFGKRLRDPDGNPIKYGQAPFLYFSP